MNSDFFVFFSHLTKGMRKVKSKKFLANEKPTPMKIYLRVKGFRLYFGLEIKKVQHTVRKKY